ncbi:DNA helicase MCM9 [Aulostomus maculatus]
MFLSAEQEALVGRMFEIYVTEHHRDDIIQLVADANEETHHPVVINAMTLFEANMEIGDYFNAYPNDVLAVFDKVLHKTAIDLSNSASASHFGGQRSETQGMRYTLHTRIAGLPVCPELTRDTIPRSRDVGHFLSVTGTVIRTSVAKVLEYERDYMCAKCRHVFTVQADFDQFYTFFPPAACPHPDGCNSYKFSCLSGGSEPAVCRDYQEIKIQEQVQRLSVGSIPRSMVVVLEDDLVDRCKSGDDVTVYGVMCQRWKPFFDGARCDVELVLKANNIEVNNQQGAAALLMEDVQKEFEDFWDSHQHDPMSGLNHILLSLCPQVFGMYVIKLAVAMVLAGGVQRTDASGTKIRGECHMLLVGDPGTGKSQFLKYAAKIIPRSVLTAGIGSTSAGLTVAAVKDGGDWHLEAGALVLSDGGLCCIDEFNSIKEHDRISIHEAMEQQSISVAKAGIVCKLNTRTTILAATNPKGQYDPNEPLSVNVALASPLLSRFDLVLVLLDTRNREWDRIISSFILEDRGLPSESSILWSLEKMKAYFCVIKRLQPQMSEEANCILTTYYRLQRQSEGRSAARTTIRMLESLSRLAEAHARLMYRERVTTEDAVMAVSVMECSMQGGGLLGNVNAILTSFPADPGRQYQTQCQILLEGLNLPHLLQKEMDRLARLQTNTSEVSNLDQLRDQQQHQVRDANTNKTGSSSSCEGDGGLEGGLDWFHSITASLASPILTSTQKGARSKPNSTCSTETKKPTCQTERDFVRHPGSSLKQSAVSNTGGTVTSAASEDKNRRAEERGPDNGKSCKTTEKSKQCEGLKDRKHAELSGCVVQKVSKTLRDRRVRELQLNLQECDEEPEGGGGGERVVTGDGVRKVMTRVGETKSSDVTGSTLSDKKCPSISLIQGSTSSATDGRCEREDRRETKSMGTVLKEKMAAQTETDDHINAKLSGFTFKPKKMRPLSHSRDLHRGSDVSAACKLGSRDSNTNAGSRECQQKAGRHDESAVPLSDTEEGRRETQKQQRRPSEGGGKRRQGSCVTEVREGGSGAGEDACTFPGAQGQALGRTYVEGDTEKLGPGQSLSTKVDGPMCTPHLKPSPSTSGLSRPMVSSSTLAKLSRFSFTCAAETRAVSHTGVDEDHPAGVEQSLPERDVRESLRTNSGDDSPEHSPRRKRIKTAVTWSKAKDLSAPPSTELPPRGEPEPGSPTRIMSTCRAEQVPASLSKSGTMVTERIGADCQSTDRMKKRKCFELGPAPTAVCGSAGLFSNVSLFGSTELNDDVLDTDWDQEVSKKAKV